jgi:hypothetical protein
VRLPDPERSRLVLIGTSSYADANLPDLPAVGRGIGDLGAALTDPVYGVVPKQHCDVLADEGDIRLIGRRLRQAARQAEDLLLVYYAGHGLTAGRRHELYLALRDTEWAEPEFNSLEYDKLRSAVLNSPAATKVIIIDCCFSGRVLGDSMADPATELIGQVEVDGSYVLASAHRDEVALILPGEDHTAFTGRLLRLLRAGVPGGPEFLTVDDLYRQLRARMKAEGLPQPQRRGTGTADLLALTRNRAFAATAAPVLLQRQAAAIEQGENGDWAAAAAALREVLAEQARILGPQHHDTLVTRQYLAHATSGAGDPLAGAAMLRKLLAEQTRLLGPDHADTLRTRQFLAVSLGEAGYRDEAIAILHVLLPDRRRVLGNDDPHTLRTAHMLARNLAAAGRSGEAVALLKEVAAARDRLLGPDHPHTARVRRDLAALLEPGSAESHGGKPCLSDLPTGLGRSRCWLRKRPGCSATTASAPSTSCSASCARATAWRPARLSRWGSAWKPCASR